VTLKRGFERPAVALATVLAVLLACACPAAASEWTGHALGGEAAQTQLFGISCPTTALCVAVGGNNTIASSTAPAAPGGWNAVYVDEGAQAGAPNQRELKGISCPSTTLCVAVGFLGKIVTSTNPTGDSSAWSVADLSPTGPNTHFYGISCPTTTFCAAVAGGGEIAVSTNPTGGAEAWTITHLAAPLELRGISCISPSFCVAVGDSGTDIRPAPTDLGEVVSSTAPLAGIWQQAELGGSHGFLFGVACPTTGLCVSGDMFGNVVASTSPTGPASSWDTFGSGATVQITAASCPAAGQCLQVDNNGDALTSSQPTAGTTAWTVQNLVPFKDENTQNGLFSVACPSPEFCALGGVGQGLTSTDPFAAPPPPAPTTAPAKAKGKSPTAHKARPKRPRVKLILAPPVAMVVPHGRALVQYRFHVDRRFQVRGYVCSFDHGKMRPCTSPQRHRMGAGHHRFRVRAVGWTGLRGPVVSSPVQVCRHSAVPGTCLQRMPSAHAG
jgi:hypothetical protein